MITKSMKILELTHNQPIREIVIATIKKYRKESHPIAKAAAELDIAQASLYRWCEILDIDYPNLIRTKTANRPE